MHGGVACRVEVLREGPWSSTPNVQLVLIGEPAIII